MIHLKPVEEKEQIAAYYKECGLTFSETSGCVSAKSGEEVLGFCLYEMDKTMTVLYLSPQENLMLADGILRSTLHVAVEAGVTDAFYDTAIEEVCRKLDFIENGPEKRLAIGKLFQSCHGCKDKA